MANCLKNMKIIKQAGFLNSHLFFLILYGILLIFALAPYYINGSIILGGEGNYVLDFLTYLKNFGFVWLSVYGGIGMPYIYPVGTGLNILLLSLLERVTGSAQIVSFTLIFSMYFLPFLAMYLLCKELKAAPFISFLCSLFYIVNPFMLYYLTSLNQWNVFSVFIMPLFLWIILKCYHNNFKLFFFFGIASLCFSFAYTNPPMLVIIQLSIILSTIIASYHHNKKPVFIQIFKKYNIILLSFLLFNASSILSFLTKVSSARQLYTHSFARGWLDTVVSDAQPIFARIFALTTLIPLNPFYDFFTFWYGTVFGRLIVLIPFLIVVYFALIVKDSRARNFLNLSILGVLLIVIFFVKGNAGPLGFIYVFLFEHLPFFNIFKTPVEKFGIFSVFILSILLLFVILGIKNHRHYKPALCLFMLYLIFCCAPLVTGNIAPEHRMSSGEYVSRKYRDKNEYKQVRRTINSDVFQYRVLSLPGCGNYQVALYNNENGYYTGLDPILMNINKPFIAAHDNIHLLYNYISSVNFQKLLGIYNIGKITINEDLIPWFGNVGIGEPSELKNIFSKSMKAQTFGPITIYNNSDTFLPRIYTSVSASEQALYE
jgi:hypothetical protein